MTGKRILCVGLFFFLSFIVFSEDLVEELHPNPVRRGYRFTFTLYLDYDDPAAVAITAPVFPRALRLVRGPSIRSYYRTTETGKSKKKTRIRYTFSAVKTGRYVLGSFTIKTRKGTFHTVPRVVSIGIYKNRKLYIPFDVSWVKKGETFYRGEAIPLVAVISNLPDIIIVDNVDVPLPSNGIFTQVDDPGPITEKNVGFQKLYTIPVAGYLYTPSRTGHVKIPRIRISGNGITSFSRPLYLDIKAPPERIGSTGAIGKFKRVYHVYPDTLLKNENIHVSVVIRGTGNLNYLEIPPLKAEGLTLIEEKDTQRYSGSLHGYTGEREKTYIYTASSSGDKTIEIPPFAFFDPSEGKVKLLPGKATVVHVTSGTPSDEQPRDPLSLFKPESISGSSLPLKAGRYRQPESYLWLLPGPLVFLIFFFAGKKKILLISLVLVFSAGGSVGSLSIENGNTFFEKGNYAEAADVYLNALKTYPADSSLYYDLALSYFKMNMVGKAVYAAHIALYYSPFKKKYSDLLHTIESISKIKYPAVVSGTIYPDTYLFLLTLFLNAAGFAGVFYYTKRKNFYFIAVVLLLGMSVVTLGGLLHSAYQWHLQYGVAAAGPTEVKKIPQDRSTLEFMLKEGETVRVVSRSGKYIFVENGIGVKGWVERNNLFIFGGDSMPYRVLKGAE